MKETIRHIPDVRDPLAAHHSWYVLMEISSGRSEDDARAKLESVLEHGMEHGLVTDGAIAESFQQRADAEFVPWNMV